MSPSRIYGRRRSNEHATCSVGFMSVVQLSEDSFSVSKDDTFVCLQENGWTPLMYAVKDNRVPLADRMIELGCDVNARNKVSSNWKSVVS